MSRKKSFNVRRLVADVGGAAEIARITGKQRTAPYRWIEQGFVNTKILADVKKARPDIIMDEYFK